MIETHESSISDVPFSRNWYKTVSNVYKNLYIYKISYKNSRFKQVIFSKYATNLKTTISQRIPSYLDLLLLLFEFKNVSSLIDLMDNDYTYIYVWYLIRPYHVFRTPTNGSAVLLSRVSACITRLVYTLIFSLQSL